MRLFLFFRSIPGYIASALGLALIYFGWRQKQRRHGATAERTRTRETIQKQQETRQRVETENRAAGADARRDRLRRQARD